MEERVGRKGPERDGPCVRDGEHGPVVGPRGVDGGERAVLEAGPASPRVSDEGPDFDSAVGRGGEEEGGGRGGRERHGRDGAIVRSVDSSCEHETDKTNEVRRDCDSGEQDSSPRPIRSMPPKFELAFRREGPVLPYVERPHPVRPLLPTLRVGGGRSRERDAFDTGGLDRLPDARDAVRGGDFDLEELGVLGGRVELEGGGVTGGDDEGLGERLDGERDADFGSVREVGESDRVCESWKSAKRL